MGSSNGAGGVGKVGKYMLLETLGEGAFGKVKFAVDETDGQQYAIKIMRKDAIKQQELTLQVRREIAVMKALHHPNIVNLHEVLNSKSSLYMVMDLVQGGELFDAVAEQGRLHENDARMYFQQLADGMHHCHVRRVYHRDIKPENLLLSPDKKTLKITDFGLSSIKGANTSTELLHTTMGSPHYIAPEIITSAAKGYEGAKVDVWASGVVLFGLLAGYLPFDEERTRDLYRAIVHQPVKYPPHFSPDVIDLISAMLVKDPDRRITFEEVRSFSWFRVNYQPLRAPASPRNNRKRKKRKNRAKRDSRISSEPSERPNSEEENERSQNRNSGHTNDPRPDEELDLSQSMEPHDESRNSATDSDHFKREYRENPHQSFEMRKNSSEFLHSEVSPQSIRGYRPSESPQLHPSITDSTSLVPIVSGDVLLNDIKSGEEENNSEKPEALVTRISSDIPLTSEEKLKLCTHPAPPALPEGPSVASSILGDEDCRSLKDSSSFSTKHSASSVNSSERRDSSSTKRLDNRSSHLFSPIAKADSADSDVNSAGTGNKGDAPIEPHNPELKIKSTFLERANHLFAMVTRRIVGGDKEPESPLPRSRGMRRRDLNSASEVFAREPTHDQSSDEDTPPADPIEVPVEKDSDSLASRLRSTGSSESKKSFVGLFKPVPPIFAPLTNSETATNQPSSSIMESINSECNKCEELGTSTARFSASVPAIVFDTTDGSFGGDIDLKFEETQTVIGSTSSLAIHSSVAQRGARLGTVPYSPNLKSNILMQRQLQRKMRAENLAFAQQRRNPCDQLFS